MVEWYVFVSIFQFCGGPPQHVQRGLVISGFLEYKAEVAIHIKELLHSLPL